MAFAMPLDDLSAIGVSLIRFGVDDILDTTKLIDQQGDRSITIGLIYFRLQTMDLHFLMLENFPSKA